MANLIGYVQGNRGEAHRLGSNYIGSDLRSWTHKIVTSLDKDGNYMVTIVRLNGANTEEKIITGNVSEVDAK